MEKADEGPYNKITQITNYTRKYKPEFNSATWLVHTIL